MTIDSEKRAEFKTCFTDYGMPEEMFRLIMEFLEVDRDSLTMLKDNAALLENSKDLINAMMEIDADNGLRMFFHRLLPSAASPVISLLPMTISIAGVTGLLSGVDAGIACLPHLIE